MGNHLLHGVQLMMQTVSVLEPVVLDGNADHIAAAAQAGIEAVDRVIESLDAVITPLKQEVDSVLTLQVEFEVDAARETFELFDTMDQMITGMSAYLRFHLAHSVEDNADLGQWRAPLAGAYRRAIQQLDDAHRMCNALLVHVRQFIPAERVVGRFNLSAQQLRATTAHGNRLLRERSIDELSQFTE